MLDQIVIEELELQSHIGITEEERAASQRLTLTMTMVAARDFNGLRDDIRNAVDYHKVALFVQELSLKRPRRLLETLSVEIADEVLAHFAVISIDLHLRKYILKDTASVGVRLRRDRPPGQGPRHR
jgi:7,8-dihydroneopterin aldolase/epimerase/oxygenase